MSDVILGTFTTHLADVIKAEIVFDSISLRRLV